MVSLPSNLTEVVHNDQAYLTSSRRQPFLSEQLKDRTLAGRPPAGSTGTYTFTVTASNGVSPGATQTFTLTVNTPVKQQAPAFTSAGSVHFTVGQVGSFTVTAGEFPVATFGPVSGLPSGLTFTDNGNNTATLAGTAAAGTECTYSFTLTAKNSVGTATQKFTLTINKAPKITSAPAALFTVGTTGSFSVTTKAGFPKGTNVSEKGALPASLVFLPGSQGKAILQGTPAVGSGGVYTITLTASNSAASGQQSFVLTVDEASGFTGAHTASFTEGTAGSFKVTTRGFPRPTFSAVALPQGLTFTDNGNGTATISGTPVVGTAGTIPVTLTASNGVGVTRGMVGLWSTRAVVTPDGRQAVSCGTDALRCWDLATGRLVLSFGGTAADNWSVALSPDGSWLGAPSTPSRIGPAVVSQNTSPCNPARPISLGMIDSGGPWIACTAPTAPPCSRPW